MAHLLTVLSAALLSQTCFTPSDARPGWKQARIPAEAPALAAPEGVEQFRSGEPAEVVDDHAMVMLRGEDRSKGSTSFRLLPGPGACALEAEFTEPLRGAKVSIAGWGKDQELVLKPKERVAGSVVNVAWGGGGGVRVVEIVVHDHFRREPVLAKWKATCRGLINSPSGESWLNYRQPPGGVPVTLCHRPTVPMRLSGDAFRGERERMQVDLTVKE